MNRTLRHNLLRACAGLVLAALVGCSGDSPTAPRQTPPGNGGGGVQPPTTWRISLSANPPAGSVGSTTPVVVNVTVVRADNGQAPPNGTTVLVTTTLGDLGSPGSGNREAAVTLTNGQAAFALYAGNQSGTAHVQVQLEQSVAAIDIPFSSLVVTRVEPNQADASGGSTVTIVGVGFSDSVKVTFSAGGFQADAEIISVTSDRIVVRVPAVPANALGSFTNGQLVADITVTNNPGQSNEQRYTLTGGFTYLQDPSTVFFISGIQPTTGRAGDRVTISGNGFHQPLRVTFGGTQAQVVSVSPTQIVAIVPDLGLTAGQEQVVDVAVTLDPTSTTQRTDTLPAAFTVTTQAFYISAVSPDHGDPTGGETVDILGTGFQGPVRVLFGGTPATVVSFSSSRIRVRTPRASVPAGQTLTVPVQVTINTNETGQATDTLPNAFTYGFSSIDTPVILSVSPASGPNEGGTQVRIKGSGFADPVQVFFGSGSTSAFTGIEAAVVSVTPTEIVVTTPAATGFGQDLRNETVAIMVKNLENGNATVMVNAFRYGVHVIVTSIAPAEGPYTGGQLVTIFGQGFDQPVAVSMGGRAQQVISVTGTEIVVRTVPVDIRDCSNNSGNTIVVNIESGDSNEDNPGPTYTYLVPRPLISSISPTSGSAAGNVQVTISGTNFEQPLVSFDSVSASVLSNTSTQIVSRTPAITTNTVTCDDNNDGFPGTRQVASTVDVKVTNLVTGCSDTLENAFTANPTSTACQNDVPPCGNNKREGGEACDGTDLGGATCQSILGNPPAGQTYSGSPTCNASCSAIATTSCTLVPAGP